MSFIEPAIRNIAAKAAWATHKPIFQPLFVWIGFVLIVVISSSFLKAPERLVMMVTFLKLSQNDIISLFIEPSYTVS